MIAEGERVLLFEAAADRQYLLHVTPGARKERGLGVFDPARLVGMEWGAGIEIAGKQLVVLRPTPADLHATVRRKAQIITRKDMGRILVGLGICAGDRVLESGIGSGAATVLLAQAVGPRETGGEVVVQELRQDFADWATENLQRAGLADRVQVELGDLTDAVADGIEGPFDAVLLDQPQPWKAITNVVPLLAAGARICGYCPQVSQMESFVNELRTAGAAGIECVEVIERRWEVKELGSRPASEGIGHTAFLVFARWLGDAAATT